MQLVKATIRKNHKERVLEELSSIPDVEGLSAVDTISFVKEGKSFSYRGSQIKSNELVSFEQTEVSCYSENNAGAIQKVLSEYSSKIYAVELRGNHDIQPVHDLAHKDVKIGFVLPENNSDIAPIYSDIASRGYSLDVLGALPLSIASLINYDILLIDMSVRKFPVDDLTSLLNIPVDIPMVLINRSNNPIDKLTFVKMGFASIHDIKNTDIILDSIYSAISHYQETKPERRNRHKEVRAEDKFVVVFSAFA